MSRLADIPTVVLTGMRGAGKTTLLGRLLRERPSSEAIAVLLTETGEVRLESRANVEVVTAEPGCVCCVGQVALRVALTRLLRAAQPGRLYLELTEPAHLARALATLSSPGLAPVVTLAEVIGVADAATTPRNDATAQWLAHLDALCMRNDADGAFAAFVRAHRADLPLR